MLPTTEQTMKANTIVFFKLVLPQEWLRLLDWSYGVPALLKQCLTTARPHFGLA
jgi:hypothetical protein